MEFECFKSENERPEERRERKKEFICFQQRRRKYRQKASFLSFLALAAMLFVTQLRRRQRYFSLLGSLIFLVFLFICLRLLSRVDVEKPTFDEDRVVERATRPANRKSTSALVTQRFRHFIARKRNSKHRYQSESVEALIGQVYTTVGDKELAWLFENCFPNTLDTTVDFDRAIPDTYVITGDIDAMWLRDSSAQIHPYLPLMRVDAGLRLLVEGMLLRQMIFVQRDPYANAHYKETNRTSEWKAMDQTDMRPGVHERKWELDSLCYVLRLMYSYWKEVDGEMDFFHQASRTVPEDDPADSSDHERTAEIQRLRSLLLSTARPSR